MAENFEDVVKKLGDTIKKPAAAKAAAVLAVQMVDSKGKVIKEDTGAGAAEEKREEEKRAKKTNTLLSDILKAMGGPGAGGAGKDGGSEGGGLLAGFGGAALGAGMGAAMGGLGKMIGPAALLAGVAMAIKDGFDGWFKSEEWGVSKISGALAGLFAGTQATGTLEGVTGNALKWGLIGAGLGTVVPVIGTAIGGAVGALFGAILGWIGGEKIAKWFDAVGTWVSEKWDEIKLFPGKIWTAIVDTVKGWIGITAEGEMPVTVGEDKPVKGWLDSLIDFLIPDWLVNFSKDALNTVLGWLGLTAEDDQGNVETTRFGKLVFGTIGELADLYLDIINFFIPQFVKDFVKSPLNTVMLWLGLKEVATGGGGPTGMGGELTTTEFGKKVFGVVGDIMTKVKDIFKSIVTSVIGEPTYDAIVHFASDPLQYILEDVLGWKTAEGEPTIKGRLAVEHLEEGKFGTFFSDIIRSIIGGATFDAIVDFVKDPVDYVLVHWLGWKVGPATATSGGPSGMGGGFTAAGAEAMSKIDQGDIVGFWAQLLKKVIGEDTYNAIVEFAASPADYILKNWFGLGVGETLEGPSSSTVAPGTGAGGPPGQAFTAAEHASMSVWDRIVERFFPPWLVSFISNPGGFIVDKLVPDFNIGNPFSAADPLEGLTLTPEQLAEYERIKDERVDARQARAGKTSTFFAQRYLDSLSGGADTIAEGKAAGGPLAAGRWGLVGEMGPELILPNQGAQVLNAQRTQQMLEAGMQRGMGGAGGGGNTSINTGGNVVSSPTTNFVNNGIAARRPIILAA